MAVSISSCPDGAAMKLVRITKYGREFEHEYQAKARAALVTFNEIKSILEDPEGYYSNQLRFATHSLREHPFLFCPFPGHYHEVMEVLHDEYATLEYLYETIDKIANTLADAYVPSDRIQGWWKTARSKSRLTVKRFEQECSNDQNLDTLEKAIVWLQCFDESFKDQLA
jgi:hypothetical protein